MLLSSKIKGVKPVDERLKELRKALGLTQKEFGARMGIKASTIGTYEIGRNHPIDAVVTLICREYSVNETWLRTGEGEMFVETSLEKQILAFMGDVMHGAPDFRRRLMSVLARMTPDEWAILERKAWDLVDEMKKAGPDGPAE